MVFQHFAFCHVCFVVAALFARVTTVSSCDMVKDDTLDVQEIRTSGSHDTEFARTWDKFTKCVSEASPCTNCVPSGYKLVNVTYVLHNTHKTVKKLAYQVTGCKCVAKKPLNDVVGSTQKSYMYEYKMMSYCTYTLAIACAMLVVIIFILCLRYERCCSKKKERPRIQRDEQIKPLTVKTSEEDKV